MEEEEPPPRPRPRAPPALPDQAEEEILLRFPPDDPARLVRAALVCKRWSRLVSGHAFRRRFRDRAGPAPMLGFLYNDVQRRAGLFAARDLSARFVRTAPSCPPVAARRGWHALDARAGRVLLRGTGVCPARARLAVWDPLAGRHRDLPEPWLPHRTRSWSAALLCDDGDDDGLVDAHFRVVLVGTADRARTFALVYPSAAAAWSEPSYAPPQHPGPGGGGGDHVDAARGALAGNALYFVLQSRARVLRYDLGTRDMSVVDLPPASQSQNQRVVLTTTGDGGLGFARMEGHRLCLWSMEASTPKLPTGGVLETEWTRGRRIELRTLLPAIELLCFAHGLGIVLVGAADGFFTVDQKSGRIDKVGDGPAGHYSAVPYASFVHTPALGTASTDQGPTSANA